MIGNKKISENSIRFLANWPKVNFLLHLALLALMSIALSWAISWGVKGFGYTAMYQHLFENNEQYSKQSKLFEIDGSNYDPSTTVLFVGSPNFFKEKFESIDTSKCSIKPIFLEIPDYTLRHLNNHKLKKGLMYFERLKFKKVVYENSSSLWSGTSTEGIASKMDLWHRAKKSESPVFNDQDISVFFRYVRASVFQFVGRPSKKESKARGAGFYFQAQKADAKLAKIGPAVGLFFNSEKQEFMTDESHPEFREYFGKLDEQSVLQLRTSKDITDMLGC